MRFCSPRLTNSMLPATFSFLVVALPLAAVAACQSSEPEEVEHADPLAQFDSEVNSEVTAAMAADTTDEDSLATDSSTTDASASLAATTGMQEDGSGVEFDEDAERLARNRARRQSLADSLVGNGQTLLEAGDLHGALKAYADALQIASGHEEARAGMRTVEALLGDGYASAAEFFEMDASREIVRRAQMRMDVDQAIIDGDRSRGEGHFTDALISYRHAEVILQYHP
ncbi:MAG: hypothetical protein ACI8TQ_000044, partial [Planctomycetota bacterium]